MILLVVISLSFKPLKLTPSPPLFIFRHHTANIFVRVRKDLNALQKAFQDAEANFTKIKNEVKLSERQLFEQADLLKKNSKECVLS